MTNAISVRTLRAVTFFALLASIFSPALAQGSLAAAAEAGADTAELGAEILVTARRREESAQDVPISLSVLGGDRLEQTNVFTLDQAKQQIPSLQIFAINPRNTNINIRGLGSNASVNSDGLDSGVGVYIDDVYYARPGQSVFDLVDIDRIEVLKGPQGTLFGRNTTAGAISISTRAPSFSPEANIELSGGTKEYVQARAAVSGPLVDDKIAVRLTGAVTRRDGTARNVRTGQRLLNVDSKALRGQLLLKPVEDFTLLLTGDYSIRKERCCVSLPAGVIIELPNGTTLANNFYDRAARLGYTLPTENAFDRITDIDAISQYTVKQRGVSAKAEWDLGKIALTSVTAYRAWDWLPQNDTDGTGLPIFSKSTTTQHQKQFSQELRIASTGTNKIDYVAGLYYFHQRLPSEIATEYGSDAPDFILPPTLPAEIRQAALNGFGFVGNSVAVTDSYAAFGQVDWNISPQLTLTVGARFTHEEKKGRFRQRQEGGIDLAGLDPAIAAAAQALRNSFGAVASYSASTKNDSLSGQVTIAYKATDDVLIYGTYARGGKSGGLNIANLPTGVSPVVAPEHIDHFEIGVKTSPLPGVTLNGAAFWINVKDFQSTFSDGARSITYLTNAAKVRSRGAELDLTAVPADGVMLYASGTFAETEYVSYEAAPCALGTTGNGNVCDLTGQSLPNAPRWAISAGGEVSRPIGQAEVYAGADWSYRSKFNSAADNSRFGIIGNYSLVNGRVGIRDADGLWDLSIWARNLFNKNYYTRLGLAAFNTGLLVGSVGDPRTFGLTTRFKF